MRRLLIALLCYSIPAIAQTKTPAQKTHRQAAINTVLKRQLDSIMILDQQYRLIVETILETSDTHYKDSIAAVLKIAPDKVTDQLMKQQTIVDSVNMVFIDGVLKKYGYPGKALVDTPTNEVAFYVIQHSKFIGKYIDLVKQAGKNKQLDFTLVAMMEDRYLMNNGKEQIYGTQGMRRPLKNGGIDSFIWPIKDPAHVNARRRKAGFQLTVEQNADRLGIKYKVVTLAEVQ